MNVLHVFNTFYETTETEHIIKKENNIHIRNKFKQ